MSLSDKHEGKILVPWFCSEEWKHVYYLIYSENSNDSTKREALQILKIWKTRQVLLSSGVEGTLIILSATLINQKNLDEENLCLIYATCIMRFLNLCAANNKKQGTFYETARRNNLPDWLISIRHDLAHDQKIPSKFMLEHCLNYCLQWLKKEYWDAQYGIVRDFVALSKIQKKQCIEKCLTLYEEIVSEVTKRGKIDVLKELPNDLTEKLYSSFKSSNLSENSKLSYIFYIVSKALIPTFNDNGKESFAEYLVNEVIKRGNMFEIPNEDYDTEGEKLIPVYFLKLWLPLLQKLYENAMLITLLRSLFYLTADETIDLKIKETAAVWLNTIFKILSLSVRAQNEEVVCDDYTTCSFQLNGNAGILDDLKALRDEVLKSPNPFTVIFVERLLSLDYCTPDYISEVKSLVSSYTEKQSDTLVESIEVHTMNDLIDIFDIVDIEDGEAKTTTFKDTLNDNNRKWCLVKDTSVFAGCPLGVLPQQKRTRNPLL